MIKSNKGFSLVELIIVIAIMAILVGVMAPQLIKYVEKSKISADIQTLDLIHTAVTMVMMDPEINTSTDPYDVQYMNFFSDGQAGTTWILETTYSSIYNCPFALKVADICGFNPFEDTQSQIKSASGKGKTVSVHVKDSGSGFYIFIENTDNSGDGGSYTFASDPDKVICAPTYVP